MSKFCKNCGKELVDGVCPACAKETKEVNQTVSTASNVASDFFKSVRGLVKSPFTAAKKLINKEENFKFGLGLIGVVTAIIALFAYLLLKEGANMFMGLLALTAGDSLSLGDIGSLGAAIPYGKLVMYLIIFFLASVAILMFCVWATYKWVFKKEVSFKKVVTFTAITYLPIGIAFLIAIPVLYIFPELMLFFIGLGMIAYYVIHTLNIKHLADLSEDKIFYVIIASFMANMILQYIILGKLLPNILF